MLELPDGLNLLREHRGASLAEPLQVEQFLPRRRVELGETVELDVVGERDEAGGPVRQDEVIERDRVAGRAKLPARGEHVVVGLDVLEQLEDDAIRRQRRRHAIEQEPPGHVDEGRTAMRQRVETEREHGVGDDARARLLERAVRGLGQDRRPEQQLVGKDAPLASENRLARDEDLAERGGRRGCFVDVHVKPAAAVRGSSGALRKRPAAASPA